MMKKTYEFKTGQLPILVSMPHNGVVIPDDIKLTMTQSAIEVRDTDWHLDRLYEFAVKRGCYQINPIYNRYVIDLNRPEDDENLYPGQDTTSLCPTTEFNALPIYHKGMEPNSDEINRRVARYWKPYHNQLKSCLDEIRAKFGVALLLEAHSIKSVVPRFFEGQLPDFNFGNLNGHTCSDDLTDSIEAWMPQGYSKVLNGRFKGGYITRAYPKLNENIHTIQLELSQATYMDEEALIYNQHLANKVQISLAEMFGIFEDFVCRASSAS